MNIFSSCFLLNLIENCLLKHLFKGKNRYQIADIEGSSIEYGVPGAVAIETWAVPHFQYDFLKITLQKLTLTLKLVFSSVFNFTFKKLKFLTVHLQPILGDIKNDIDYIIN